MIRSLPDDDTHRRPTSVTPTDTFVATCTEEHA